MPPEQHRVASSEGPCWRGAANSGRPLRGDAGRASDGFRQTPAHTIQGQARRSLRFGGRFLEQPDPSSRRPTCSAELAFHFLISMRSWGCSASSCPARDQDVELLGGGLPQRQDHLVQRHTLAPDQQRVGLAGGLRRFLFRRDLLHDLCRRTDIASVPLGARQLHAAVGHPGRRRPQRLGVELRRSVNVRFGLVRLPQDEMESRRGREPRRSRRPAVRTPGNWRARSESPTTRSMLPTTSESMQRFIKPPASPSCPRDPRRTSGKRRTRFPLPRTARAPPR